MHRSAIMEALTESSALVWKCHVMSKEIRQRPKNTPTEKAIKSVGFFHMFYGPVGENGVSDR